MTRVPDLPELTALSNDDILYVVDVSNTSDHPDGSSRYITADKLASSAGNVLRYGADPTGVSDSTAAFQSAVDSSDGVYVPYGDFRIDGTVVVDKEKTIICERGQLPNYRYWTRPDQSPFDFSAGTRCRLFKDDASTDSAFFKFRWGDIALLGYPLLDVSDKASFTSAGVLLATNEDNPNSTSGFVRGWHGWIEIICLGNIDTLPNAGEGMKCIYVQNENPASNNGYFSMQNWHVIGQNVAYGAYLEDRAPNSGQFFNSLTCRTDLNGCKSAVYNGCFTASFFEGIVQARNCLDPTEHPMPVVEIGENAKRCKINIHAYDLNDDADSDGHYRMSYFIKNRSELTSVFNRSSYDTAWRGLVPTGRQQILYAPGGVIPHMARNTQTPSSGMVITPFYNELQNMTLRATSFTYDLYQGQNIEQTHAITDAVFSNTTSPEGATVDIISASSPTAIPDLEIGARFDVTDHSVANNNGEYLVTARLTNGYRCEKQPDDYDGIIVRVPATAAAEAITITTGFGAMTTDSVSAGVATSSDWTEFGDFAEDIGAPNGGYAAIQFGADAVTDADYFEMHFEGFNFAATLFLFSFISNGGWQKVQVIRRLNSSPVTVTVNEIVTAPLQNDEDGQNLIQVPVEVGSANDTIFRFIGPLDSSKAYTFMDVAAVYNFPTATSGHFLTKRGGEICYKGLTFGGHINNPTATTAELEDITSEVNTSSNKVEGSQYFNSTTNKPVWAAGNADGDVWVDSTGATVHSPV